MAPQVARSRVRSVLSVCSGWSDGAAAQAGGVESITQVWGSGDFLPAKKNCEPQVILQRDGRTDHQHPGSMQLWPGHGSRVRLRRITAGQEPPGDLPSQGPANFNSTVPVNLFAAIFAANGFGKSAKNSLKKPMSIAQCFASRRMDVSLYQAAAAMNATAKWQDLIAENMAAASISGARKQEMSLRFPMWKAGSASNMSGSAVSSYGIPSFCQHIDQFSTRGFAWATGNPMDFADRGARFFHGPNARW